MPYAIGKWPDSEQDVTMSIDLNDLKPSSLAFLLAHDEFSTELTEALQRQLMNHVGGDAKALVEHAKKLDVGSIFTFTDEEIKRCL